MKTISVYIVLSLIASVLHTTEMSSTVLAVLEHWKRRDTSVENAQFCLLETPLSCLERGKIQAIQKKKKKKRWTKVAGGAT